MDSKAASPTEVESEVSEAYCGKGSHLSKDHSLEPPGQNRKDKKKSRFAGKKMRKKKHRKSKDADVSDCEANVSENAASQSDISVKGEINYSLRELNENVQPEERLEGEEPVQLNGESSRDHSTSSRPRSTSRGRLSTLFRRKKRCKSEPDISDGGRSQEKDKEEEFSPVQEKQTGAHGLRKQIHKSADNLNKNRLRDVLEIEVRSASNSPKLKSSLKPSPMYRAFDVKTNPRDRLKHMTIRDAENEQRERRSRSLPRQRRQHGRLDSPSPSTERPYSYGYLNELEMSQEYLAAKNSSSNPLLFPKTSSSSHSGPHSLDRLQHSSVVEVHPQPTNQMSPRSSKSLPTRGDVQIDMKQVVEAMRHEGGYSKAPISAHAHNETEESKNRRKASLTHFLTLSKYAPGSSSSIKKHSINENKDLVEEDGGIQQPLNEINSNDNLKINKRLQGFPKHDKPRDYDNSYEVKYHQNPQKAQKSISPKTLPLPMKLENHNSKSSSQKEEPIKKQSSRINSMSDTSNRFVSSSPSTHTTVTNPRVSLNDNEITTADMIDLGSASMSSSINPDVEEERSSTSSGQPLTSLTSSYRSSDQGYVDGDSIDSDDETSNFSTPPEETDSKTVREVLPATILQGILRKYSKHPPEPTLGFTSDIEDQSNASKSLSNVQRSSSDVDRSRYVSPRTFGRKTNIHLPKSNVSAFHKPANSTDKLPGSSKFVPSTAYTNIQDDCDRASLTSTVTLTSLDAAPSHNKITDGKVVSDQKAYPAAQHKYRRTFSPARTRKKMFPLSDEPPGMRDTDPLINPMSLESSSFEDIDTIIQTSSKTFPYNTDSDSKTSPISPEIVSPAIYHASQSAVPSLHRYPHRKDVEDEGEVSIDDILNLDGKFPPFAFTGFEASSNKVVSQHKSKGLVSCLKNQSAFNLKRQHLKEDGKSKPVTQKRSFLAPGKHTPNKQNAQNEIDDELIKSPKMSKVKMIDKDCQTPMWLLEDLLTQHCKSPSSKKKSNMFSNKPNKKKKKMMEARANLTPLKIPTEKESLLRNFDENRGISSDDQTPMVTALPTFPGASGDSAFKLVVPRSKASSRNVSQSQSPSSPQFRTPASAAFSLSDEENKISPGCETVSSFKDALSISEAHSETSKLLTPPADTEAKNNSHLTPQKPKRLSFTAIILLKNRIAKYREKKGRDKEGAPSVIDEKIEVDCPSDTVMSLENEINLSKLEISKETDILDDDDMFQPEFPLDFPSKQLRFDPITAGEPIQGEEPLPPLPPASTRRLRQRRESTMRERRKKCLSYCKKCIAFLFSHIGLCSVVVAYTIVGGFIFQALEAPGETTIKLSIKVRLQNH